MSAIVEPVREDDEWQQKQGTDDLAGDFVNRDADDQRTPGQEEPCLGVVPFHEGNLARMPILIKV